jgi:hypothetical protein
MRMLNATPHFTIKSLNKEIKQATIFKLAPSLHTTCVNKAQPIFGIDAYVSLPRVDLLKKKEPCLASFQVLEALPAALRLDQNANNLYDRVEGWVDDTKRLASILELTAGTLHLLHR